MNDLIMTGVPDPGGRGSGAGGNPAGQYFLNDDLRAEEIREQVGELCRAGYECIFLHARAGLRTPYFSQEWFDALSVAVDELVRHGVKFAIWDEDNFPSGDAGNRICNSYPELSASRLNFLVAEAKAGKRTTEFFSVNGAFVGCFAVYEDGTMRDLAPFCGTLRREWNRRRMLVSAYSPDAQLPYPHRRRSMDTPRFAVSWTADRDCRIVCVEWIHCGPGCHSSDLLDPETARILLGMIHEEYPRRFGDRMKHCFASFMDEPAPYGDHPWTRRFPEEFRRDHGYDLMPLLPHLILEVNETSPRIRNDYRKTLHRLLCRNYLDPIRAWLNARGILSAGHLTRSEYLQFSNLRWPNELRCFKHLDIPCCDPLGAGIGQPGAAAHHIGIKAVASAARLFGKRSAGADAFAVGGDTISLRDLQFMLNYHLVMGVTWFNVHGLYYTLDGERRDEAPPSLFYQHSQWEHMPAFLAGLKRRCAELAGEHVCELEVLYPSTAFRAYLPGAESCAAALHGFAEKLLSRQRDFELIDEETLIEQDPAAFAALRPFFVIAHAPWIEAASARWLESYVAAGGTLFVEGEIPRILPGIDGRPGEIWYFAGSRVEADPVEKIPAPALTGEGAGDILIRRVRRDDRILTFLFNRGSETFHGTLEGRAIEIAPGAAGFADELGIRRRTPLLPIAGWEVTFGSNSVPLRYWETFGQCAVDLLTRQNVGELPVPEEGGYHVVFTLERPLPELFLTTEEETLARGGFRLNGTPLSDCRRARFRDCREWEYEVGALLKPGRNKLEFFGRLPENPPFLRGRFQVRFPYGPQGYPVLSPAPESFRLTIPPDYAQLGYGTYAGRAVYESTVRIAEAGRYVLELESVNDSVRIVTDGVEQGILIAPPYRWEMELSPGEHRIRLEVCNAPGNRDVMSGVPAGVRSVSRS